MRLSRKISEMSEKELLHFILCNQIYIMQKFDRVWNYLISEKANPKEDLMPWKHKGEILEELYSHAHDTMSQIPEFERKNT